MKYAEIQQWFNKNRDVIVVVLVAVTILLSIIVGMKMQKDYGVRQRAADEKLQSPEKVRLAPSQQIAGEQKQTERKPPSSYFLKPSPDEVLSLINEMGGGELPVSNQKYSGLRVMWPVYFFQVREVEPKRATVTLDVNEDGFGVTIETQIDTSLFPEILTIEPGTKVWLAGEILGVDPAGTGTIHMLTEEVRFQEGLMDAIKDTQSTTSSVIEPQEADSSAGLDITDSKMAEEEKP